MGDDITLPERPHRRSFTAEYKLAVLTESSSLDRYVGGPIEPTGPLACL